MQCKERLVSYLNEHQVPFQAQQHARAFSAQKIAEGEHIPGNMVAKTVIILADNKMMALVLPASYRADLNKFRAILGAKEVRLAHEEEFTDAFPDCAVGAMPPFGNLYGMPVYVEESLSKQDTIVFPDGTYTETMSLHYADFDRLVHPQVIAFAQPQALA